jgi:Domain of unknown function (DUF5753)
MHEQLLHLADMSHRPNVTIGVVPLNVGAHTGLLGGFAVAEADGATHVAYLESPTVGFTVGDNAFAEIMVIFDTTRADALPRGASRDLIMRRAEEHGLGLD